MLKLLFKTTAYYIIWQKFKKQIILVFSSIILISFIGIIYEDLLEVMKVNNRDSVGVLLFFKWFLIFSIIGFNIYVLRKTNIDPKELNSSKQKEPFFTNYSKKEQEILKKEDELITITDLILKKYEN